MNRIWHSSVSLVLVWALSTSLVAQTAIATPKTTRAEQKEEEATEIQSSSAVYSWQTQLLASGVVLLAAWALNPLFFRNARPQADNRPVQRIAALGAGVVGAANQFLERQSPRSPPQTFGSGTPVNPPSKTLPLVQADGGSGAVPEWMTPILGEYDDPNEVSNSNFKDGRPAVEQEVVSTPMLATTPGLGLRNHSFRILAGPRDSMEFVGRDKSVDLFDEQEPERDDFVDDQTQFELESDRDSITQYIEALFHSPLGQVRPMIAPSHYDTEVVIAIEDDSALEREVIEMLRTPDAHGARFEPIERPQYEELARNPVVVVTIETEHVEVVAGQAQGTAAKSRTARKTVRKPNKNDLEIIKQSGLTTAKRTRGKKDADGLDEITKNLFK